MVHLRNEIKGNFLEHDICIISEILEELVVFLLLNVASVVLKLSFDTELMEKFWFLKRVISPILETYYVAACRLTLLQQGEMPGIITKYLQFHLCSLNVAEAVQRFEIVSC